MKLRAALDEIAAGYVAVQAEQKRTLETLQLMANAIAELKERVLQLQQAEDERARRRAEGIE